MTYSDAHFGRVAVLCGGNSSERNISIESGIAVYDALKRLSINSQLIDIRDNFRDVVYEAAFDRAFIAMHGSDGEDGSLQGALKLLNIPFTGSHVLASALAMDKRGASKFGLVMDWQLPITLKYTQKRGKTKFGMIFSLNSVGV